MNLDGHKVFILSGDLDVSDRLDIPQVNLIINWNMPTTRSGNADWETYLHRIGRSGRFGKEGVAVNFITSDEMYLIKELESQFGEYVS
ncbi:unnamed protein product [Trichobilharzia regenti]|nr:unnamed protein product [Trichobilharzia regenti]